MKILYCKKCGKELIRNMGKAPSYYGFNQETGKPNVDILYEWKCPSYHCMFGTDHSWFTSENEDGSSEWHEDTMGQW
jgi:hypothetical protein